MRFLSIILFGCISPFIISQNIKNKYTYRSNSEGSLYFIYPQKGFKSTNSKLREFEYDMVYLSNKDSLTYNFTYFTEKASKLDSVIFKSNENPLSIKFDVIFVQPHKDYWKNRISLSIPKDYVKSIYQNTTPYKIEIYSEDKKYNFEMNTKEWDKQSTIVNKIFEVIKYNK